MNKRFRKIIYIILGSVFLLVGILGMLLPILPTTPFLLLTSYFYTKGSDTINNWFISTSLYKNHLKDFVQSRSMTLKSKLSILLPVSLMLILTFIFIENLHARVSIGFVILFKYYYFFNHIETVEKKVVENGKIITAQTKN